MVSSQASHDEAREEPTAPSHVNPFDEHESVEVAFSGLNGRILQNHIWKLFAVNANKLVTKLYFDKDDNKMFERHVDNDRHQQDTVNEYCEDIKAGCEARASQ